MSEHNCQVKGCKKKAIVGWGVNSTWLCKEHFNKALGIVADSVRQIEVIQHPTNNEKLKNVKKDCIKLAYKWRGEVLRMDKQTDPFVQAIRDNVIACAEELETLALAI